MYPALGVASFLESTVVPIPLEAVLVPLMQRCRSRMWWLAAVALLGCVLGAVVGYYVGVGLMETAGQKVIDTFGWQEAMDRAEQGMAENGFLFIFSVSVIPVPFQVAMLAAGATGYPLHWFLVATLLSRGLRYFGLALLVWWLGDYAEQWIKKHKTATIIIGIVLVAGAWIATRYL